MQANDHFHDFHAFDYVPATWRFIRERFARQAKALKNLTGLKTAQCYNLIAWVGGYAGWAQMSQAMDVLEAIERHSESLFYAEELPQIPESMATALAAVKAFGEAPAGFWLRDGGIPDGLAVSAILARAKPVTQPAALIEEYLLDGLDAFAELRFAVCTQATWCGHTHIAGIANMDTMAQAHAAMVEALGSEAQADAAVEAMYGEYTWWDQALDLEFQLIERAARQALAGQATGMSPDLTEAYLLADEGGWQTVATWRKLLRESAPHSLDVTSENGPLTALVLNNAPPDALVWIRLTELELEDSPRAHYFVTDGQIWVPTTEQVGAAAACSGSPPQHTLAVTPEVVESYHLPVKGGYLLTWE